MTSSNSNIDAAELAKFDALAARWWDPEGEMKPLHEINPLRLGFIDEQVSLAGKRILDIGCGGGILAESMSALGAKVTAIDASEAALKVASLHQMGSGIEVDYHHATAESFADSFDDEPFDVVTCLELLEHVPDPGSVVKACAALVSPGGSVFFSTINRNLKAYGLAVVGAEYLLRLLPRGTHDYAKFIKPSELDAWARHARLRLMKLKGMSYNPLSQRYALSDDISVNYLAHFSSGSDV